MWGSVEEQWSATRHKDCRRTPSRVGCTSFWLVLSPAAPPTIPVFSPRHRCIPLKEISSIFFPLTYSSCDLNPKYLFNREANLRDVFARIDLLRKIKELIFFKNHIARLLTSIFLDCIKNNWDEQKNLLFQRGELHDSINMLLWLDWDFVISYNINSARWVYK